VTTTKVDKITVPENSAQPVIAEDLYKIVSQLELYDVMQFASTTERTAVFTTLGITPNKGSLCYLQDVGRYEYYNGTGATGWVSLLATAITKLDEQILSGAAASVTFSAISASYRHLQIRAQCRSDTVAVVTDLRVRFNGDTAANYYSQASYGQAAATGAAEGLAQTFVGVSDMSAASAPAGHAGAFAIELENYAATVFYKQFTAQSNDSYGTATAQMIIRNVGGRWQSTAAINSVTLFPAAGNFIAGSTFTLYGLP
jgi:hypothetical protein